MGSIPIQHLCQVDMLKGKNGETRALLKPEEALLTKRVRTGQPVFCSDIPEWLENSEKILWMAEILKHSDSHASSSHEPSLEPPPPRIADLGKQSVYNHFPKERNCEICQRTKNTSAPCRRRNGGAEPRAENFGDLITADH